MNTLNKYTTRLRPLFLSLFLLITGSGMMWGQDTNEYKNIGYKYGERQKYIPEKIDTLFVQLGDKRELFVPDMRINDGTEYRWYVRWYLMKEDKELTDDLTNHLQGTSVTHYNSTPEGGTVTIGTHKSSLKTSVEGSLFWYNKFNDNNKDSDGNIKSSAVGASSVIYTCQANDIGLKVVCDVSLHTDYEPNSQTSTFTEPTLSKRYVFVIADAKESAARYDQGPEEYTITAPAEQTKSSATNINLQMRMRPDSYRWHEGDEIVAGSYFEYAINGQKEKIQEGKQVIPLKTVENNTKVTVYAKTGDKEKAVTTFTIYTQEDAGFMLEEDVKGDPNPKRHPAEHPDLYEEIGYVDFDYELAPDKLKEKPNNNNNMWQPTDQNAWKEFSKYINTTYSFLNKDGLSTNSRLTPLQNQFGLYRSANDGDASLHNSSLHYWYFADFWYINSHHDGENLNKYQPTDPMTSKDARTIYDRTHSKNENEYGYFYYVDASNEPGRIVRVPIEGDVCRGTELLVTAWVNDMTRNHVWNEDHKSYTDGTGTPLPANINLNFIAVKKTNDVEESIILHRFTSGNTIVKYNNGGKFLSQNLHIGKWQQLAYSFTIDPKVIEDFEQEVASSKDETIKYYLEVQNNTAHTDGADYAIDDIRIYRSIPRVEAWQANSFCDDEIHRFEIAMDYESLLKVLALHDNDHNIDKEYNINANGWNEFIAAHPDIPKEDYSSMRKVQYYIFKVLGDWERQTGNGGDLEKLDTELKTQDLILRKKIGNIEALALNYPLIDAIVDTRKEYYKDGKPFPGHPDKTFNENRALYDCFAYFYLHYDNDPTGTPSYGGQSFISTKTDLMHQGSSTSDMLAAYDEKSHRIFFQNILVPETEQSITSGYYIAYIPTEKNAAATDFNDRCGLITPFELNKVKDVVNVVDDKIGETTIDKVTSEKSYTFTGHFYYKTKPEDEPTEDKEIYFDWFFGTMDEFQDPAQGVVFDNVAYSVQDILDRYHSNGNNNEVLLNHLDAKWGGNSILTAKNTDKETLTNPRAKLILQTKSIQLTTAVGENNFPLVMYPNPSKTYNKEDNGILYCINPRLIRVGGYPSIDPGDPELPDYPEVNPDDPNNNYLGFAVRLGMGQIEEMQRNNGANALPLQIPIFNMKHADPENGVFGVTKDKLGELTIPTTDVQVVATNDDSYSLTDKTDKVVANITALELPMPNGEATRKDLNWNDDYFQLKFNDKAVSNFREGFWYKLKVPFYEKVTNKSGNAPETTELLAGSFNVILKIVPEFVTWVGAEADKRNWNNDNTEHWKRSTKEDLYDDKDEERAEQYHTGQHYDNAYTPMRFTHVIIQNEGQPYSAYPHLYELKTKGDKEQGETEDTEDPDKPLRVDHTLHMTPPAGLNIGYETRYIEYDLAVDKDYMITLNKPKPAGVNAFTCVRFYGNTCKEIYFKPQTELMRSEYLTYEKAWIDYELDANRWYTLASPLKGVVAGDMYLPGGLNNAPPVSYGIQKMPAFIDITYEKSNGTRWDPAVYMRGWDKSGTGTVVVKVDNKPGIQYAVEGTWSNLYNKVDEPFTPGTGFSIGAKTNGTTPVLFRLPKADTSYKYYDENGETNHDKGITRDKDAYGKLFISDWINSEHSMQHTDGNGEYQLIGNPFMAHLDMKKFFEKNKLDNTYYILTGNGTETSIHGDEFSVTTRNDDPTKVAPLQSFLVKKGEITFTTDMQTVSNTSLLRSTEPEWKKLPEIRITAERKGERSTSVIAYLSYASDGYNEEEDASLLISKEETAPQVYTVADKQMLAINLTNKLHDIPVGIYGTDNSPVTLTFSVSDRLSDVTLYDRQEKKSYPIAEGTTLTVPGNTSGRYLLNGSIPTANEVVATNRIICYSSGNGRIDISSVDPITRITIYDQSGRIVKAQTNLHTSTTHVDGLQPGQVYIVRAESTLQEQTEKVKVQ
ncbi:T9SS type A sorting domain-containing protein [Parabacteroides sp.]